MKSVIFENALEGRWAQVDGVDSGTEQVVENS